MYITNVVAILVHVILRRIRRQVDLHSAARDLLKEDRAKPAHPSSLLPSHPTSSVEETRGEETYRSLLLPGFTNRFTVLENAVYGFTAVFKPDVGSRSESDTSYERRFKMGYSDKPF